MSLYRSQSSVMYSRYPYYSTDVLPGSTVSVLHRNDESTAEIEQENINKDYSADIELCQDLRRCDVMGKLLISGFMSDCKFIVGPDNETAEIVPGHKLLFTLASPVFEEMLNGSFKEAAKNSEIRITDTDPRDFKNFRYIIYNNDASLLSTLPVEDIIQVYILSDKYMATSLAKYCLDYLTQTLPKMSADDITLMFQFARGLEDKVLLLTVKHAIRKADAKNCRNLNVLNEKEFYEYILVLRNINKPLYTFSIIESYFENKGNPTKAKNQYGGTTESETLKEDNNDNDSKSYDETLLIKCLKCVDFADVNAEDFKKGPGESKILTFEQKYFILSRLGCSKSIVLN